MPKSWLIPMAGRGTRTQSLGKYKPFINVRGRKIIEWLLLSLSNNVNEGDTFVFVLQKNQDLEHGVVTELKMIMGKIYPFEVFCKFELLDFLPSGPALTVLEGLDLLPSDQRVIVINSDQYNKFVLPENPNFVTGIIDFGSSKSYFLVDGSSLLDIYEKNPISSLASSGVYGFRTPAELKKSIIRAKETDDRAGGELYISHAIKTCLSDDIYFVIEPSIIRFDLGSIAGITQFLNVSTEIC